MRILRAATNRRAQGILQTTKLFLGGSTLARLFPRRDGTVKISRVGPDGRQRVLHVVEQGDAFAEAAMFMDAYPATAEALTAGTTVIPRGQDTRLG